MLESVLFLFHVLLASVLGGVIGWERQEQGKPAGVRTHMLVAVGSALFVVLSEVLIASLLAAAPEQAIEADPIRILEAVVVGLSLIGGGVILKDKAEQTVLNLTTAASIFVTGGVAIATVLGEYILAIGVTLLILMVNRGVRMLEERIV